MVKHTQTNRRPLPTNCLSAFEHFPGLAFKRLTTETDDVERHHRNRGPDNLQ